MLTIDADAHVIECEKTWDYLEGEDRRYRPVSLTVDMPSGKTRSFWFIGGRGGGGRGEQRKNNSQGRGARGQTHTPGERQDRKGDPRPIPHPHAVSCSAPRGS